MKKATAMIMVLLVLAIFLTGCQSKDSGTGYATYSGQSGGDVGGGGCGRFAADNTDSCAEEADAGVNF